MYDINLYLKGLSTRQQNYERSMRSVGKNMAALSFLMVGCTSHRYIINFLANSLGGTFFVGSVDASSEIANDKC
jgi:hypothetical protein